MSDARYSTLRLPSQGRFYGGRVPNGEVAIRKLTVNEETIIQSTSNGVDMISKLVSACTKLPDGFRASELLATDRMAILIGLRVFTFGPSYNFEFKCQSCGAKVKADLNLAGDLRERQAKEGVIEPFDIHLADCDKTVGLRFLRGVDESEIAKTSKRVAMSSNDGGDQSAITRMALQLVTIDGEPAGDMATKEAFIKGLALTDSYEWRDTVDESEPGIDLEFVHECRACGAPNDLTLPFSVEFFRPTRNRA